MLQRAVAYGPVGLQLCYIGHVYPHEKGEQESGGALRQIQPDRLMAVALALDGVARPRLAWRRSPSPSSLLSAVDGAVGIEHTRPRACGSRLRVLSCRAGLETIACVVGES
jgi:hypothetical protein